MSAATAVIAAQAAQRKKLVRYFVSQGAITAERAIAGDTLPQSSRHALDRLQAQGVVRTNSDGNLYLDQRALLEADQGRRAVIAKSLLIIAVVMLLVAAVGFWAAS